MFTIDGLSLMKEDNWMLFTTSKPSNSLLVIVEL